MDEYNNNQHQFNESPQHEETPSPKEGKNMKKWTVMFVVLGLLLVIAACAPVVMERVGDSVSVDVSRVWSVDLNAVGFANITFSPLPSSAGTTNFFRFSSDSSTGECSIYYHENFDTSKHLSEQIAALSYGTTLLEFTEQLFSCGNGGPLSSTDADWFTVFSAWVEEYERSCGDLSFNRVGWIGDPSAGPGVECVPHYSRFVSD